MAPVNADAPRNGDQAIEQILTLSGAGLALLGDQVTRQFLSTSLGWEDYLLLASGPLGVIPVVVSTIRIAGPEWLKNLIGRSRDEPATVEKELLSSTSTGVCEAWTGTTISRTKGSLPPGSITALIVTENGTVLDVQRNLYSHYDGRSCEFHWKLEPDPKDNREMGDFKFIVNGSPNFSLNLREPSRFGRLEAVLVALLGLALQFAAWAVSFVLVGLNTQERTGTVCYLAGAIPTFMGLIVSGYITDAATTERCWRYYPTPRPLVGYHTEPTRREGYTERMMLDPPVALVWLQRGCVVEAQYFPPYAVWKPSQSGNGSMDISVSLRNEDIMKRHMWMAIASTALAVPGTLAQLYGIWVLGWIVGLVQLVLTIALTGLRAFVRRNLALYPATFRVTETQELASLVISITEAGEVLKQGSNGIKKWIEETKNAPVAAFRWGLVTGRLPVSKPCNAMHSIIQPRVKTPQGSSIRQKAKDSGIDASGPLLEVERFISAANDMPHLMRPEVEAAAKQLGDAIEGVAELLRSGKHADVHWRASPIFGTHSDLYEEDPNRNTLEWEVLLAHGKTPPKKDLEMKPLPFYLRLESGVTGLNMARRDWAFQHPEDLCATISLWLSRLDTRLGSQWRLFNDNYLYKPQIFARVAAAGRFYNPRHHKAPERDTLERWIGRKLFVVGCDRGKDSDSEDWEHRGFESVLFGMHLTYPVNDTAAASHDTAVLSPDNGAGGSEVPQDAPQYYYITLTKNANLVTQCARELFSLFIDAIAAKITDIGGKTSKLPAKRRSMRVWDNSLLTALANEAVVAGVVSTLEEGLELVVSAFLRRDLLPEVEPTTSAGKQRGVHNHGWA